jgi:hypothetical protein
MNLLRRYDVIRGPNQTLLYDDGEPGNYIRVRTEDGLWMDKSIAADTQEIRQREADALRRELTGVEFRLAHLDDPQPPWLLEVPNRETIERERTSLENTRKAILSELELREGKEQNVNVSERDELQRDLENVRREITSGDHRLEFLERYVAEANELKRNRDELEKHAHRLARKLSA